MTITLSNMTFQSQTLSRLAAAHRGAVRALQTFVSHAPLQPKIGHGLPPMYQELSALIRQLSQLAAQLHIGGEDLTDDMKRTEDEERKVDCTLDQYFTCAFKSFKTQHETPLELSLLFSVPSNLLGESFIKLLFYYFFFFKLLY